jgi:uncharacterized membrane protein YfcA
MRLAVSLRRPSLPAVHPLWALLLAAALLPAYLGLLDAGGVSHAQPAAVLAVLLASALSSIAGFAFSAIAGAMLFQVLEGPVRVVAILVLCSIAIQALSVWTLRRDIAWRALLPLLLGGLAGLPLGLALLLAAPARAYAIGIGLFLIAYGAWTLLRPPIRPARRGGAAADAAVGLMGGITGGLAAFPGAAVTIWCGMQGWDKARQRAIYQPFILAMQLVTLAALWGLARAGGRPAPIDLVALSCVPAALIGTLCGLALFRRLNDAQFGRWVALLLIASGLGLVL